MGSSGGAGGEAMLAGAEVGPEMGAGAEVLVGTSTKCAFTSPKLPSATVISTWQPTCTVAKRSVGVKVCSTSSHVPSTSIRSSLCTNAVECSEMLYFGLLTVTSSTCAPWYLMITHPRSTPEMIKSVPWAPVLFEPRIEWILGCKDAGTSTSPSGLTVGPQPIVYSLSLSQEPV